MPTRKTLPSNLPKEICEAVDIFSDEELAMLTATYDFETKEFIGIAFLDKSRNKFFKFADPKKAKATKILEDMYRKELKIL